MKLKYVANPCRPNIEEIRYNLEIGDSVECHNGTKGTFLGYADDPGYGYEMVLDVGGFQKNVHIANTHTIWK